MYFLTMAKDAQRESWKKTLGSQGTYLKTGIVTALKRVSFLFLRG